MPKSKFLLKAYRLNKWVKTTIFVISESKINDLYFGKLILVQNSHLKEFDLVTTTLYTVNIRNQLLWCEVKA